jgi:hypothetical protein
VCVARTICFTTFDFISLLVVVFSGSVAFVQTPATVRAKELRDLYHSISAPLMSSSDVDSRLDVLLNLKVRLS